jgi:hypothetical protein
MKKVRVAGAGRPSNCLDSSRQMGYARNCGPIKETTYRKRCLENCNKSVIRVSIGFQYGQINQSSTGSVRVARLRHSSAIRVQPSICEQIANINDNLSSLSFAPVICIFCSRRDSHRIREVVKHLSHSRRSNSGILSALLPFLLSPAVQNTQCRYSDFDTLKAPRPSR